MAWISKCKARVRYELGTKVSVATTHMEGFVLDMRSMPGEPFDGHTRREALEQVEIPTVTGPKRVLVDTGYRVHGMHTTAVYISGSRRWMTPALRRDLRQHSMIERAIGHLQTDARLPRCPLNGTLDNSLHAGVCGCGHRTRMILAHLRVSWAKIQAVPYAMLRMKGGFITAQLASGCLPRGIKCRLPGRHH